MQITGIILSGGKITRMGTNKALLQINGKTLLENAIQHTYSGFEVVPVLFPASSDNIYYRNESCPVYGLNPMILSPQQIRAIHNNNEFIDLDDIDKGIEVFEKFLSSVLLNQVITPANKNSQQ